MSNIKEYKLHNLRIFLTDTTEITNIQTKLLNTRPICSRVLGFANALFAPLYLALNKKELTLIIKSPKAIIKNLLFVKSKTGINSVIDVTKIETQDDNNCNNMKIYPLFNELGTISIISNGKQIQEKMVLGNLEFDLAYLLKKTLNIDLGIWSESKVLDNKVKSSKSIIVFSKEKVISKKVENAIDGIINSMNTAADIKPILKNAKFIKTHELVLSCDHSATSKFIYKGNCMFCRKEVRG